MNKASLSVICILWGFLTGLSAGCLRYYNIVHGALLVVAGIFLVASIVVPIVLHKRGILKKYMDQLPISILLVADYLMWLFCFLAKVFFMPVSFGEVVECIFGVLILVFFSLPTFLRIKEERKKAAENN